jgi:hypothetical protein
MYSHDISARTAMKLSEELLGILACAGQIAPDLMEDLSSRIVKDMRNVSSMAYNLSVAYRRDILSVNISVTDSRMIGQAFNSRYARIQWEDMGSEPGDHVIAEYSLGLIRSSPGAGLTVVAYPRIVTTALLRYAQRNTSLGR